MLRIRMRAAFGALAVALVAGLPVVVTATPAGAAPTDLFFSEYVEGSSNNKALEIYNGTGGPVSLSGYAVQMFFNGSATAGLTINLSPVNLASGDVYVLAQSAASPAVLATADQTNGAGWFNGDDAVVLRGPSLTVVDSIGQVGLDPGTEWGSGLTSTADNTLRRKAAVQSGDTITTDAFDPAVQWDGFAVDTFGGLGTHGDDPDDPVVATCGTGSGSTGTAISAPVSASDGDGVVTDIAVTNVAPSDPGTISRTAFTPASSTGGTANATITASGSTPAGTYTVTVTATNNDATPKSGTCAVTITVTQAPVCGDPATLISAVQGSGTATPMAGTVVTVEGIVVGDYQGTGQFSGYYVQEEDAQVDGNDATSEGIFVFNTSTAVNVGDKVRVRGTAGEFSNLTQLSNVTSTTICPATGGSVTPTSVSLPVPSVGEWERYEGMSIDIPEPLTVTEVFTLARFGEVALSAGGRLSNPTNVVEPGAAAVALQDLNDRSRILLDDGNNQQNIDPTRYPQGGLSASNTLRVGDTLADPAGVLEQRFGVYRIQPVDASAVSFTSTNPRPAAPAAVGGNLRVAAFNVLNYFNGNGAGGGYPTARGATTPTEFARQRAKIVSAITALDADVVGLMELENDDTDAEFGAVEDLVAGLNDAAGAGTYDFVDTGVVGTDAIRVGIIYQPAVVQPVGAHAILDSTVDPRFVDTKNRPSIAQTFELVASGARFTAVVNHLKSKGSDCNDIGDPDTGDGQGNCNVTRTNAARALVDWLAGDPTGSGDSDVILLGDMNSYAMEDPITVFRDAGYVDTIDQFIGDEAYSYVFSGQSGYLDHALASPSLATQVSGVSEWHANADEPVALDYNVEFKSANHVNTLYAPDGYRSSDHDPVLVGVDLNGAPTVDAGGPYSVVEGSTVTLSAAGDDPDGDTLSYAWDLDGDGTYETAGESATFSAAGIEAPATRTVGVQVSDAGGLTATDTAVVQVIWDFEGFLSPVNNLPTVNTARAGSSVPVRFSLTGNQGLAVLAAGSPSSVAVACATGAPLDAIEETVGAGNSGLTYDAATDSYTYVWRTSRTWTGCRRLTVTLADGTVHQADFSFTR
jgi:uncharacterized protein